jgi:protease PrsW
MPRSLRGRVFVIAILSIVIGLLAGRIAKRVLPADKRAELAAEAGNFAEAESIYWQALQQGPVTVPLTIAFIEAHDRARALYSIVEAVPENMRKVAKLKPQAALPEAPIDAFFARTDLPREVTLIAQLHRGGGTPEVIGELEREANKDPPMPWANHALGREAHKEGRIREAADRLEREAMLFDREDDLEESLMMRLYSGDRAGVTSRLNDPRIAARAPARLSFRFAMEQGHYGRALRYLLPYSFPKPPLGPLALAIVSALAWFTFCARLGQLLLRPRFRVPLYLAAFGLGVLSITITHYLIEWQELVLHLRQDGSMVRDAIFFIFGVGFREELSKLVCFIPLLPLLRARGTPLDIVTCGALVGLGFASVENINYFTHGDLSAALARFLTANFLHMTMTALICTSFSKLGKKDDAFFDFTVTFLTVVVAHGVYDFFAVNPIVSEFSFLSMAVFVLLARDFVLIMHDARLRAGRSKSLLPPFAYGMAAVCGASFIYGSALVGPQLAAEAMYVGMLGAVILIVVFVRQLRAL